MKQALYDVIHRAIDSRDRLQELAQAYPEVSYNTLLSIYSKKYQEHTRKNSWRYRKPEVRAAYYQRYLSEVSNGAQDSVMLALSEEHNIAPCLFARIILECHVKAKFPELGETKVKSLVSGYINRPEEIDEPRLQWEVRQCVQFDDNYSPLVEKVRHAIGLEYEYILQEKLHNRGITFKGEEELRSLQFPKTPDVLLDVPLGVGNHVVRWIESKASFGDHYTHSINLQQCFSYVNRYGPGLVIYWFGFIDELDNSRDKGVLVMDDFPPDIVRLHVDTQK